MSDCPYCGQPAADVHEEIAHMQAAHRDIIRERLRRAGIESEPMVPDTYERVTTREWLARQREVEESRRLAAEAMAIKVKALERAEKAEAEAERLRKALRPFVANRHQPFKHTVQVFVTPEDFEVAIAALSGSDSETADGDTQDIERTTLYPTD